MCSIGQIKQIIKNSRWQQRNGLIIHDVTSVKYNKEQNCLILVDMFSKIKQKSVKTENKEFIKLKLIC